MKKMLLLSTLMAAFFFLAAQPPTITSFTPTYGPAGTAVTITGTNFSPNPSENIVYFGAVKAPVVSASPTLLTVTVPAGATYQPLTVMANGLAVYSNEPFIVTPPDCISSKPSQQFLKQKEYELSMPFPIDKVEVGDMTANGKPDLVLSGSGRIFIYRNGSTPGAISFPDTTLLLAQNAAERFVLADLDGDGRLDLTVAGVRAWMSVFRNTSTNEKIQFAPVQIVQALPLTLAVSVADINLDGKPDLVTTSFNPDRAFSVLVNTSTPGQISFSQPLVFSVDKPLINVAAGDLDGDGKPDLVIRAYVGDQNSVDATPYIFRNASQGYNIQFEGPFTVIGTNIDNISLSDIDGDSKLDIVTSTFRGGISVYRNKSTVGTIQFGEQIAVARGTWFSWSSIPLANLAGDNKPDLFEESFPGLILVNLSTPDNIRFEARTQTPGWEGGLLVFADLDGDGLNDMVTTSTDGNRIGNTSFLLLRNTTFCTPGNPPTFLNNEQIVLQPSCADNDGQISIIPTSGTPPFRYSIDGGNTYVEGPDKGFTFTNLGDGVYHLRLKDANELESDVVGKDLFQPPFHLDHFFTTNASCGTSNGSIDIVTKCGDAPYHLRISGRSGDIVSESGIFHLTQLPAGLYTISITDAVGTPILGQAPMQVGSFEVTVNAENCPGTCVNPPAFLNNRQIVLDASCNRSDGQLSLIPTSGTAPFMYSIDGGFNYVQGLNVGHTFTNLVPGIYQLRIKDGNGCESEIVSKVVGHLPDCPANPNMLTEQSQQNEENVLSHTVPSTQVIAYPNPTKGMFRIQLNGFAAQKVQLQVLDSRGVVVQSRQVNAQETNTIDVNLTGKAKGLYLIRVVSDKGTQQTKVLIQ